MQILSSQSARCKNDYFENTIETKHVYGKFWEKTKIYEAKLN